MIRKFDDSLLSSLDLRAFNNGVNPYTESDSSIDRAFERGVDHYRDYVQNRVQAAGHGRVLDLLCGFGRWLPFLAECNDEVVGVDVLEGCTRIAQGICNELKLNNVSLHTGDVSCIENFDDESFDVVWIWSGLQYVHRGKTLRQVHRLLKPGGRLYVGAYNGPGIMIDHLHAGVDQEQINAGASQWALNALVHGEYGNGNPNYLSPANAANVLTAHGFELIVATEEGGLSMVSDDHLKPNFKGRKNKFGLPITIEFVAKKPRSPLDRNTFIRSMLGGDAHRQSAMLTLLREPGAADNDELIEWLEDANPLVRQNARRALISRGMNAVPTLTEALCSASYRTRAAAADTLCGHGLSAVGSLLTASQKANNAADRQMIDDVIDQIVGFDGNYDSANPKLIRLIRRIRMRLHQLRRGLQ